MDSTAHSKAATNKTRSAIVLVVDDNPTTAEFLVLALQPHYRTFSALSGEDAIGFCVAHVPDLVILDQHMNNLDGILTCKMLKAIPGMEDCPIVFATSDTSPDLEVKCWDAGATDFIHKPFVIQSLVKRIHKHIESKLTDDLIENMVFVDPASGLYNRGFFNDNYIKQLSLANRYDGPLSLVMFEVVNSPLYSKREPTKILDEHFNLVAKIIVDNLAQPTDILTRYSENEIALLMPDSYIFTAKHSVKKIMDKLTELKHDPALRLQQVVVSASMASLDSLPKNVSLVEQALNILAEGKSAESTSHNAYYVA
ncbi:GGDEF domain-containing response regulator [Paraglaciecola aestuariivivens]